ncbi:MAG TPA: glutathione synthase [Gemmatimonadaceae bacterium]
MIRRLGVVMDPIATIHPHKDSTLAMLIEAQRRGWSLTYMELDDLCLRDGRAEATGRALIVHDDSDHWFELGAAEDIALGSLDVILMRKDPPMDLEYLAATFVLDRAEAEGALVVNRPRALRDANEKAFTGWFPGCSPPTLVTRDMSRLRAFANEHGAIVLKPLYAMGGRSVYLVRAGDPNTSVILEEMTERGRRTVVAQAYVPDVATTGDKRILMVDGEPVPHAIARMPPPGELRANIAAGGSVHPAELDDRDYAVCATVGPILRERGLWFVGLDVIGGFLTEINVTSPTCIREIDQLFKVNVAGTLCDVIERLLTSHRHRR